MKKNRRDLMRTMAEITNNPANVVPTEQEEVALFMVEVLKGNLEGAVNPTLEDGLPPLQIG